MSLLLTRPGGGGILRLILCGCMALAALPILAGGSCDSAADDYEQNYEPPPPPEDPTKTRELSRQLIINTKGGKVALREVLIWNVREKRWIEVSTKRTELPSPGLGAGAQASTTSTGGGAPGQQAIRYPDLALFTGGVGERGTFASTTALLYDHTQETWTALSLLEPRVNHAVATLLDGRILIAGGWDGDTATIPDRYLASAELFDPASRTIAATGSMTTPRINFAAARLLDGRVLITGGVVDTQAGETATAEIYDPATGTFSATNSMLTPRTSHAAITLNDGRALVVGSNNVIAAEAYDPASGTFSALPNMNALHGYGMTATKLLNGRVLIIGGADENFVPSPAVEIFDPATDTFAPLPPLAEGRRNHSAVLSEDDGLVLVCGGYTGNGGLLASCLLFDPATDTFSPAEDMDGVNVDFVGVYLERAEE